MRCLPRALVVVVVVAQYWVQLDALPLSPPPPPPHHLHQHTPFLLTAPTSDGTLVDMNLESDLSSVSYEVHRQPFPPTRQPRPPCAMKSIEAWADEKANETLTFHYRAHVENPQQCQAPPTCDEKLELVSCGSAWDGPERIIWRPKVTDSIQVCEGGCVLLQCGSVASAHVHLPLVQDDPLLIERAGDPELRNPSLLVVPVVRRARPAYVRGWEVTVAVPHGRQHVGRVFVEHLTSLLEIHGNYSSGAGYTITYTPKMIARSCNNRMPERLVKYVVLKLTPADPSRHGVCVTVVVTVVVVLLGVLALVFFLMARHRRRCLHAANTHPWLHLHKSKGDILMVHAHDTPWVVADSHDLAEKISSHCGRKVRDLCCLNDRMFVEDPSVWLMDVLTRQEEVTIMVVVTPALTKAVQHTKQGHEPKGLLGPKPDARDPWIHYCLDTLLEKPDHYYHRLVLIRLEKDTSIDSGELMRLTPRRPFLLSKEEDCQRLRAALHPHPSHTPTHNNTMTCTPSQVRPLRWCKSIKEKVKRTVKQKIVPFPQAPSLPVSEDR